MYVVVGVVSYVMWVWSLGRVKKTRWLYWKESLKEHVLTSRYIHM